MELGEIHWLDKGVRKTRKVEARLRDIAFLPIGDAINGVEVEQFKFKHYKVLIAADSPFIVGGKCDPVDIGTFMWVVSGKYTPSGEGRDQYIAGIMALPNGKRFHRAIQRYIERAMFDCPPSGVGKTKIVSTSVSAGIVHKIAFAYHYPMKDIDELTMSAIFQLMKWIYVEKDPGFPQFNPLTDRLYQRAMVRMNATNGATHNGG